MSGAPVRKGLMAVRHLVRINHPLVTHRRMPPDHGPGTQPKT